MKFLGVLSVVATVVVAKPGFATLGYTALPQVYTRGFTTFGPSPVYSHGVSAYSSPIITPVAAVLGTTSQYHTQDELGQASYGHSEPFQSHNAIQDAQGNKVGSFSYVSPDGQIIRTDYVADALGYRVSSNALPVSPTSVVDTPEVVAARTAHLAQHSRTRRSILAVGRTPASTFPLKVAIPQTVKHHPLVTPTVYSAPVTHTAYITPYAYTSLHYPYF